MTTTPSVDFNDPDLFLNFGAIYERCIPLYGVIDICLKISTEKACAVVKLVGVQLDEKCVKWQKSGSKLSAKIDFGTVSSGIHKLSGVNLNINHDLATNDGFADMTATLYKYSFLDFKYKKVRDINEKIASW